MVNNMQRAIVLEHLLPLPKDVEASDPNDTFLLAMALASEEDYLVTGDRRAGLLQRGRIGRTRIVTPAAFCAEVLRHVTESNGNTLDLAANQLFRHWHADPQT